MPKVRVTKPAKKAHLKRSRAALRTIELAVDTVAHSIRQLKVLRTHMHRGHRRALLALSTARHHSLSEADLGRVEDMVGGYARVADWPANMRSRSPHDHLERPLSEAESTVLAVLAGRACCGGRRGGSASTPERDDRSAQATSRQAHDALGASLCQ
jgi:hypothetical protein